MSWIITGKEAGSLGLLDQYGGAAAAYSLRNLSVYNTDPVVRVRRSSDNTEQDFTAAQITDGTLTAFCGAGDGFVRTWYDQSGNNLNAQQTTTSRQPKIVNSGAIVTENGKPSLTFNGTSHDLVVLNNKVAFNFLHNGASSTISSVVSAKSAGIGNTICGTAAASSEIGARFVVEDRSGFGVNAYRSFVANGISGSPSVNYGKDGLAVIPSQVLLYVLTDADAAIANQRSFLASNGGPTFSNNTSTTAPSTANATNDFRIGSFIARATIGDYFGGTMQEIVLYPVDQSTNRAAIEANINAHYGIF